jgi:hypothetical protein
MTGSSGGIGPSIDQKESCEDLSIQTHLSSPNPDIIDRLNEGDILTIRLGGATGPIELVTDEGKVVGSLVSSRQMKLIECINDGHQYIGEIREIEEGNCEVYIRSSE